jgi:hypothetical protein
MGKRTAAILSASLSIIASGPTFAQDGATIRLAPRQGAATPTLYAADAAFARREGVDRSLFGARADTPMPIPAGRRLNMVLEFEQHHPGRTWECEVLFSFEPRAGGAYRVVHTHRFDESCSAEVIDLSTGTRAESFRLEPFPIPGLTD